MAEIDEGELFELDQLLNDPDVPMHAARVWEILDQLAKRSAAAPAA